MAAQPTAMASRNWMLRRMMLEMIRRDPEWNNGDYASEPQSMKIASVFFRIATSGGTLAWQKAAPTSAQADKIVDDRLAAPFKADANDFLYQWGSSPTTMPRRASNASRLRCLRSMRPTTSAIRRKPASRRRD